MRNSFLIFVFLFSVFCCIGQKRDTTTNFKIPSNDIFIEIFGNGRYPSLNYERILYNKNKFYLSGKLGYSYYYEDHEDFYYFKTYRRHGLIMANGLFQVFKHLLIETGIGVTQQYYLFYIDKKYYSITRFEEHKDFTTYLSTTIALRIQSGHFLMSFGFTPLLNLTNGYRKMTDGDCWYPGYAVDPLCGFRIGASF